MSEGKYTNSMPKQSSVMKRNPMSFSLVHTSMTPSGSIPSGPPWSLSFELYKRSDTG